MKRTLVHVLICSALVLIGCNRMSERFRHDASYAYELVLSADNGNTVLEADVQKAMATVRADAKTPQERRAIEAIESYLTAIKGADNTPLDRRYVEVCRWEAAKQLDRQPPTLTRPAQMGVCNSLRDIRRQRAAVEWNCNHSDSELNGYESKLDTIKGNPSEWLRVYSERNVRQQVVKENCKKLADSQLPPIP